MPNTLTIAATAANTTKAIEYRHPNTGVYQTSNVLTAVTAGTYAAGTVYARLVGSSPAITASFASAVTVLAAAAGTPHDTFAAFNGAGWLKTGTVTACKSFLLWVKAPAADGSDFLFSNADTSDAYYFQAGNNLMDRLVVNGALVPAPTSLAPITTNQWQKVYIELTFVFTGGLTVLSRHAQIGGSDFTLAASVASLTLYDRVLTAGEQADATGPNPTTGVLASYNFTGITGTSLPDQSGNNRTGTLFGTPPVITLG